ASGDHDDSAMKTLRSKMGKWCCHCFPCCRGSGKSNVDDSAFVEPRYHVRREDLDKLHRAAWWGKVPRKDPIVMLRDTDVNKKDKQKRTALHLASANGNSEVVKLLLDRQCQLNVLDNKKRTALIKAVQCQEDECALILLEHGTDPNMPDEYGNTTLHYAIYNEDKLMAKTLSYLCHFRTALILAVCCGSASIVSLLLEQNIDVSSQDLSGQTAREYAVSSHHTVISQLLSDYKEKQMVKISSENSNPGKTCNKEMSQKYNKQINLLFLHLQKRSQEPEINKDGDREIEIQFHSSTCGYLFFPGHLQYFMKIKISSSDEQNDTQKQFCEEQNTGILHDEILIHEEKQIEVAE
uniref:POTE ankyrin domain family member A n=1 Tax=Gorilla gorilla gorilla TaxID=9595 RepID=G3RPB0_GORGO